MEKIIVNANTFDLTEEEEKELKELSKHIAFERKRCVLKYFDYSKYANKKLEKFDFYLTVFWALARDCIITSPNEKGEVQILWRVKDYKHAPKLVYIKEKENGLLFTVRYYLGIGTKSKKELWTIKRILCTSEELEKFKEEYKNEIETLYKRTFSNEC